LEEILTHNF